MRKKKLGIISTVMFLVIVIFVYLFNSKELYGNDIDSIEKVIKSIEGYENKQINILNINDFNEFRVVGFLSNRNPSYIEFHKNQKGNYVWRHIESENNVSFSLFIPLIQEGPKIMFVTNNNNKIAKILMDVNGKRLEQEFLPFEASVTWVELPQSENGDYDFENYRYYDKDGNLIKDN
jgi:hypothetical protein